MIDIKLLRENPQKIAESAKNKRVIVDINAILELDKKRSEAQRTVQKLQEERNALAKSITGKPTSEQITKGRELKESSEKEHVRLEELDKQLQEKLGQIPNLPKLDVKVGKDESENDVIKKYKEPTKFSFTPKDHLELGESLDIIDVKTAGKVSGPRFNYLKNEGVLLEFALVQLALEMLIKEGFTPIVPPVLIKESTMKGLGYMENGGSEDMFHMQHDDLFLVGTAEHSLVPMHMDEILQKKQLPLKYVGFSTAFRREAGSYGKDTRGILRVHQFDKVEMVLLVEDGKDDEAHEYLLSLEEKLFQLLDIPYQVIKMCTGDLGFPTARKYDIEAWMPGQNKYREVTSASTIGDFQSRRLHIRYSDGDEKKYVNILNGTAFAVGRTLIAILENYQQEDGSVVIPEVLRKTLGKEKISPKK
ncbi:MAG: serine--tRNA ligase [Patescibacteria group bacterium]|nr:serine--tRNA ligase [Patescibacteria group bacterium]MDE2591060.1 serine--tRNA ligase [Patescibacteria group bacterium]